MKKKVLFRADAGASIGHGHLVRSLSLARMIMGDHDITFCCRMIPDTLKSELDRSGFTLEILADEEDFHNRTGAETVVVLDGYNFGTDYQRKIKATSAFLVCIDDLHNERFYADMIINQCYGATPSLYRALNHTQYFLGPDYVLLRPSFLKYASSVKDTDPDRISSVFICFGGSDPGNFSEKVLEIVSGRSDFSQIFIVTGSSKKDVSAINEICLKDNRISHYRDLDEEKLVDIMLRSGIAIVPASGILNEALAAGCKVISGVVVENQKDVYSGYLEAGVIIGANEFDPLSLSGAIDFAVKEQGGRAHPFDGLSAERFRKVFAGIEVLESMQLRVADIDDLDVTFMWARDPEMRAYSFKKHTISREEHTQWYLKKLKSPDCIYYIGVVDNDVIGQIRFDINEGVGLINYSIDPAYKGQGYGRAILVKGIKYLDDRMSMGSIVMNRLEGMVMKGNIASIRAFEKLNFTRTEFRNYIKFEMQIS